MIFCSIFAFSSYLGWELFECRRCIVDSFYLGYLYSIKLPKPWISKYWIIVPRGNISELLNDLPEVTPLTGARIVFLLTGHLYLMIKRWQSIFLFYLSWEMQVGRQLQEFANMKSINNEDQLHLLYFFGCPKHWIQLFASSDCSIKFCSVMCWMSE